MFRLLPVVLLIQGTILACSSMESYLFFDMFEMSRQATCSKPSLHTTYTDLDDFNVQMKDWHDYFRCLHGSSTVTIDSGLKASAQAHAEALAEETDPDPKKQWAHSGLSGVGENIWGGWASSETKYPAWKVVRGDAKRDNYGHGWYCSEYESFDFNAGRSYQPGAGHFSQVVWKASTKIGCGVKKGSDGWTKVVCLYSPHGNISGTVNAFNDLQDGATYSQVCPSTNT